MYEQGPGSQRPGVKSDLPCAPKQNNERDTERERERNRVRQTDRDTETDTQRDTDRGRETDGETDRKRKTTQSLHGVAVMPTGSHGWKTQAHSRWHLLLPKALIMSSVPI